MNAFFYYRSQFKAQIEETCSTTNSNEISKVAAARWKNEPDDVKKIYRDMSKKAYDAFKLKVASFLLQHPDFEWNKKKKVVDISSQPRMILPKRKVRQLNEKLQQAIKEETLGDYSDKVESDTPTYFDTSSESSEASPKKLDRVSFYSPHRTETPTNPSFDELVVSFIREFDPTYGHKVVDFEDLVESCLKEFNPLYSY
ncbi:hypothetical protein HK103_004980 [Boothiomyces macroporosus]|uniref:HMG box domain-containing protein n=1 Tax=Boothiomyces macroporosus TaxID=261099 RepID=A0AAD5UK17_9FUNG|nr:hypothetical protein HK103_004980 [Boothiomyces macroporosus]